VTRGLHWFRNDLRLGDNTALSALAAQAEQWLAVFVLDPRMLGGLAETAPRRRFLLACLEALSCDLQKRGIPLLIRSGNPEKVLPALMHEARASLLSFNRDATPFSRRRDAQVQRAVERNGHQVLTRLDHVVFQADEVRSASGGPYRVYTPYRNAWRRRWTARWPIP